MPDKGQTNSKNLILKRDSDALGSDFVLEKSIFSNIFERDIRRVFIYKKAERLAKAIHLVTPAFAHSVSLRNRIDSIAIGLVDAAILPPASAKGALSRELLALSSVLSIAHTSGLLSSMNAELITREAHLLLQEVASYEEPQLFFDEAPTLSSIAKRVAKTNVGSASVPRTPRPEKSHSQEQRLPAAPDKGQIKDTANNNRRDAIVSVIRTKGQVYIKDISTVIRDVSEKTIQRELTNLIKEGVVAKKGERRWSAYSLV